VATGIVNPAVEAYAITHTAAPAERVVALREEADGAVEKPQMSGGFVEVALLEALAVATNAGRILEIGTFVGVTALSLAAKLPADGRIVTLEIDEQLAAFARRHFEQSPLTNRIDLRVGNALELLETIPGPFDLVFVDAFRPDYLAYYEAVLPKLAGHGLIVVDNVLRQGLVIDPPAGDEEAAAAIAFNDAVQGDPRVDNVLLTIGDGVMLIWKRGQTEPPNPGE
jgi:caffeoyl-CoA O-methyltransferase